jgi:hypothetical protein
MTEAVKIGEAFQKLSKDGFDAVVRSYGEVQKGFKTLASASLRTRKRHLRTAPGRSSSSSVPNLSSR